MTTAKNKDFIGLKRENCLLVCGEWTFGGGIPWSYFINAISAQKKSWSKNFGKFLSISQI